MYRRALLVLIALAVCLSTGAAWAGLQASDPEPANGAVGVVTPLLRWVKGDTAAFHNVYLGTTPDLTEADRVVSLQLFELYFHVPGFDPGVTYYWRVDEVEADGVTIHTGNLWSFLTQALTAYYPMPADGATGVVPAPVLTWMPGADATEHHLYFGDNFDTVSQGAAEADQGTRELGETSFTPGQLDGLATYFWRVDETLADGTVRPGAVWSFTTYRSVDDFESYTDDEGSRIYESWIDGWTNGTGATVGYLQAPFAEQVIVNDGGQSMPLDFNNVDAPHYSEAELTWATAQDWASADIDTLTVHFRGTSANDPGTVYVAIEDSSGTVGVAVYPDPNRATMAAWTRWEIPTSTFSAAGVNLAAVRTIYVGVGDRDNPTPGGAGVLYVDDIYLGQAGSVLPVALFAEDFEGVVLGPKVDEGLPGLTVWSETPPPGWFIDESGIPGIGDPTTDGVTEWAGWSFADKDWWTETAGDQNRSQFTRGIGTVAIADPDEWDDATHADSAAAGWYKTYMSTRPIDISMAESGTLVLEFDSSWRPEFDNDYHQTANLTVAFDGGDAEELFRWESQGGSPNFKPDATNERVVVEISHPGGAQTMVLTFGLFDAGNDWWWAIDNIEITAMIAP